MPALRCSDALAACRAAIHRQIAASLFHDQMHSLINSPNYACSLNFEDLSRKVVHEVKRRVIDSFGCALGAWNEEPCVIARKVASDFSAKNGATIIGTDHKAPPDWAAFATGCCIRYFDYNDTYLSKEPAHPSDNIAAVLAVGGKRRREWPRADHRDRACLRSAMSLLRCRQHSRARLGSSDLWRVLDGAGLREADEARSGKDATRGQHRGRELRGVSAGARRGTVALERRGLRECGAAWRLRGAARARGHDRSGADFRRRDGIRKRTWRVVRQRRRSFR